MSVLLSDNAIVGFCRQLDEVERDLRDVDGMKPTITRLQQIRLWLRLHLPEDRRQECGYVPAVVPSMSPRSG
jgi:hypothetical protein